jgi:tetratricopeptide (TPR) repeat protein
MIVDNLKEASRFSAIVKSMGHIDEASLLEGQIRFLDGDFRGSKELFDSLHTSTDQFVRSTSYYASACVLAETGQYGRAIATLKEGADADAKDGAIADQADKLLAISYLHLRWRQLPESREFALASLEIETSLRRSADVGSILARAGWTRDVDKILHNINQDSSTDFQTLTRTVDARIRGELLLARKQTRSALGILKTWKQLNQEPAFLSDSYAAALAAGEERDAFDEFHALRRNRGQIWHQPESYMPGADTDLLFFEAREAARLGRPEARELLADYCKRREKADPSLPEVVEAISLLRRIQN